MESNSGGLVPVQFPAILDTISTKKDGSFKLVIETRELTGEDGATILSYRQKEGFVTFHPNSSDKIEVPEVDAEAGQKTKSQRLRGCIYKLWESQGKKGTFDEFYNSYMERVIELVKDKIN